MLDLSGGKAKAAAPKNTETKDATDASFMVDVIEASKTQPVIVDFWAPWCGPCRQLTPLLEKVVAASKGAVRLVKINIDENPRIAAQLRVQSIPTVYAFAGGQPVDGFQGALPESQLKAFVDALAGPAAPSDAQELLVFAAERLAADEVTVAAKAFTQILQLEPDNVKAIAGLARCHLASQDVKRAKEVVARAAADAKDPELDAVKAALALAQAGGGEIPALERRVASDPADLGARFDLAGALASKGRFAPAADQLLEIIAADREWRGGEAKRRLLTVLEAAGPGSEVARAGRRRLSSLLFA